MSMRQREEIQEVLWGVVMFSRKTPELDFQLNVEKILEIFRVLSYFVLPITFLVYALGFLVWNIYLSRFGVFEGNFLQTRYLATGVFSSIVLLIFVSLIALLGKWIAWRFPKNRFIKKFGLIIFAYVLCSVLFPAVILYSLFVFPHIPRFVGGAEPVSASLLGTPEQMEYLSNFNIRLAANAEGKDSVQTVPVCVLYQNDDYVLIGPRYLVNESPSSTKAFLYHRLLYIESSQILGFQFGLVDAGCNATDFYIGKQPKD